MYGIHRFSKRSIFLGKDRNDLLPPTPRLVAEGRSRSDQLPCQYFGRTLPPQAWSQFGPAMDLRRAEEVLPLLVWSQFGPVMKLRRAEFCPALEVRLKGLTVRANLLIFRRQSSPMVRRASPPVLDMTSHLKVQAREELRQRRKTPEMTIS